MGEAMAQKQKEDVKAAVPVKTDKQEEKYIAEFLKVARKIGVGDKITDNELKILAERMYTSNFDKKSFDEIAEKIKKNEDRYQSNKARTQPILDVLDNLLKDGNNLLTKLEKPGERDFNKKDLKDLSSYDALALQYALYFRYSAKISIDGEIGKETLKELNSYLFMNSVVKPAVYGSVIQSDRTDNYKEHLEETELKPTKEKTILDIEINQKLGNIEFNLSQEEQLQIIKAVRQYKAGNPALLEDIIFRYAYSSHGAIAPKHVEEAMLYMICFGQQIGAFELKKGTNDDSPIYTMPEFAELMKTKKGRSEIIKSFQAFENDRVKEAIQKNETGEIERMKSILTLLAKTWLPSARGGTGANLFGVEKHYVEGSLTNMLAEWEKIQKITDSAKKSDAEKRFMDSYFGKDTEPVLIDGLLGPQTILSMLFFVTPTPPKEIIPPIIIPIVEPMFVVSMVEKTGWVTSDEETATFDAKLTVADERGDQVSYTEYLKLANIYEPNAEIAFYGVYILQDRNNPKCWFIVNPNAEERKERKTLSAYFDAESKSIYAIEYDESGNYTINKDTPLLENVKLRTVKQEGKTVTVKFNYGINPWKIDKTVAEKLFILPDKIKGDTATFTIPNYPSKEKHLIVDGNVREKTREELELPE